MERSTIVRVHEGLHARPATRFVRLAKSFESNVEIAKGEKSVSAKSPVKLMLLGVKENDEVTVKADGADAIEAVQSRGVGFVDALIALANRADGCSATVTFDKVAARRLPEMELLS